MTWRRLLPSLCRFNSPNRHLYMHVRCFALLLTAWPAVGGSKSHAPKERPNRSRAQLPPRLKQHPQATGGRDRNPRSGNLYRSAAGAAPPARCSRQTQPRVGSNAGREVDDGLSLLHVGRLQPDRHSNLRGSAMRGGAVSKQRSWRAGSAQASQHTPAARKNSASSVSVSAETSAAMASSLNASGT